MTNDTRRTLEDIFLVLTHPSEWMQIRPYSRAWDEALQRLMAAYTFTKRDEHTAWLGNTEIWLGHGMKPWAAHVDVRPSRATNIRALRKLHQELDSREVRISRWIKERGI